MAQNIDNGRMVADVGVTMLELRQGRGDQIGPLQFPILYKSSNSSSGHELAERCNVV